MFGAEGLKIDGKVFAMRIKGDPGQLPEGSQASAAPSTQARRK